MTQVKVTAHDIKSSDQGKWGKEWDGGFPGMLKFQANKSNQYYKRIKNKKKKR